MYTSSLAECQFEFLETGLKAADGYWLCLCISYTICNYDILTFLTRSRVKIVSVIAFYGNIDEQLFLLQLEYTYNAFVI